MVVLRLQDQERRLYLYLFRPCLFPYLDSCHVHYYQRWAHLVFASQQARHWELLDHQKLSLNFPSQRLSPSLYLQHCFLYHGSPTLG